MNRITFSSYAGAVAITFAVLVWLLLPALKRGGFNARSERHRPCGGPGRERSARNRVSRWNKARVKLLFLEEDTRRLRDAVRQARIRIELNGQTMLLYLGHLPFASDVRRSPN